MCNEAISGSRFLATARRFAPRCFYTAIARRALRFATCRTFSWHGEHLSVHKLGWWVWVAPDDTEWTQIWGTEVRYPRSEVWKQPMSAKLAYKIWLSDL